MLLTLVKKYAKALIGAAVGALAMVIMKKTGIEVSEEMQASITGTLVGAVVAMVPNS